MIVPETHAARLLIVDDQQANIVLLERLLRRVGYHNLSSTTDAGRACSLVAAVQPDLLLLDLHMPPPDGFTVLEQLGERRATQADLPILVLTADVTPSARQRALMLGASDFLTKPFDATEIVLRIGNLLQTRILHRQLQQQNALLEEKVRARTRELEEAELEVVAHLALASEYRDDDTGEHTQRVGQMAYQLAMALGLPAVEAALIGRAAPLHDVGKIGIPDAILLKPGKLTDAEMAQMRQHTTIGDRMLAGSRFPLLQMAAEIALTHHERWDGSGYPQGLSGAAIPLAGRIVALADVFDALTHERPYKKAWSAVEAVAEIARQSGRQFDPHLVQPFTRVLGWDEVPGAA